MIKERMMDEEREFDLGKASVVTHGPTGVPIEEVFGYPGTGVFGD